MAGSDVIGIQFSCFTQQKIKIYVLIAADAGIGCPPGTVLPAEIGDNFFGENIPYIIYRVKRAMVRQPGFEPGFPPWQGSMLPNYITSARSSDC